jgi:hypothetical protein
MWPRRAASCCQYGRRWSVSLNERNAGARILEGLEIAMDGVDEKESDHDDDRHHHDIIKCGRRRTSPGFAWFKKCPERNRSIARSHR